MKFLMNFKTCSYTHTYIYSHLLTAAMMMKQNPRFVECQCAVFQRRAQGKGIVKNFSFVQIFRPFFYVQHTHKLFSTYLVSLFLGILKIKHFHHRISIHYICSLYEHSFFIKCSGRLNDFVILIRRVMCADVTKNSLLIVPLSMLFHVNLSLK